MKPLLEPWVLGGLRLRNRLVMAPVKTAYGAADGRVTERHLHAYVERVHPEALIWAAGTEAVSKALALKRLGRLANVTLLPPRPFLGWGGMLSCWTRPRESKACRRRTSAVRRRRATGLPSKQGWSGWRKEDGEGHNREA